MLARAPTPVSPPLKKWKSFLSAATTTQKLIFDKTDLLNLNYLKCFLSLKESRPCAGFSFCQDRFTGKFARLISFSGKKVDKSMLLWYNIIIKKRKEREQNVIWRVNVWVPKNEIWKCRLIKNYCKSAIRIKHIKKSNFWPKKRIYSKKRAIRKCYTMLSFQRRPKCRKRNKRTSSRKDWRNNCT